MDQTPNLALPYIMGQQAQKYVTHNEALKRLDVLVQASVADRQTTTPPGAPADGARYIVPAGAGGAWAGRSGQVAAFQDGAWAFYAPQPGWTVYVLAEDLEIAWDGTDWRECLVEAADRFGVNTAADATNRLAVKSDALLFSHDDVTPGTGDIRATLNKAASGNTASLLFQDNWSGRAEVGLTGSDDLTIKTSPDGATFRASFVASAGNGSVSFPSGVSDLGIGAIGGLRNLLINGQGGINQRGFAGGALAAGAYGPDRWRAGAGGCTLAIAAGVWTLTGPIEQVVEAPGLANRAVTLSIDSPTQDVAVAIGSQTASIPAGAGRRSATVTLGSGDAGDLAVRLTASAGTSFADIQLEPGPMATPFERRPVGLELLLCQRYFQVFSASSNGTLGQAMAQTTNQYIAVLPLVCPPRTVPSLALAGALRIYRYDGTNSDATAVAVLSLVGTILRLTVTTATYPGSGLATLYALAGASLAISAEF